MTKDFSRYHFRGQRESEVIMAVIHRHWFDIATHFILIVLFAGLIFASLFALPAFATQSGVFANQAFILFLQNTFFLFLWMYTFLIWIDYYFDVWIITKPYRATIYEPGPTD